MRWLAFGTYDVGHHPRVCMLIDGPRAEAILDGRLGYFDVRLRLLFRRERIFLITWLHCRIASDRCMAGVAA